MRNHCPFLIIRQPGAACKVCAKLILISCLLSPLPTQASGSLEAIKQRQMIEQEAYQRAVAEEYMRRQQAAAVQQYMMAYQQAAVAQYVEAQKQAVMVAAAQQQMAAQYMAQQMAQEIAAYQQAVARRQQVLQQEQALRIRVAQNVGLQQAVMASQIKNYMQKAAVNQVVAASQQQRLAEYRNALVEKTVADKLVSDRMQTAQAMQAANTLQEAQQVMAYQAATGMMDMDQNRLYEPVPPSMVKEVVGVSELWKSMDVSARPWALIIDKKAKGLTVKHYIDELAKEGATVRKDPLYYVQVIDDMAVQNPQMLQQPFKDILRIVAIIDYDYDNGQDKDMMARKIFPNEKAFQANKARVKGQ
jgi:hypothetical protein